MHPRRRSPTPSRRVMSFPLEGARLVRLGVKAIAHRPLEIIPAPE